MYTEYVYKKEPQHNSHNQHHIFTEKSAEHEACVAKTNKDSVTQTHTTGAAHRPTLCPTPYSSASSRKHVSHQYRFCGVKINRINSIGVSLNTLYQLRRGLPNTSESQRDLPFFDLPNPTLHRPPACLGHVPSSARPPARISLAAQYHELSSERTCGDEGSGEACAPPTSNT